jgi:hypothetical protein
LPAEHPKHAYDLTAMDGRVGSECGRGIEQALIRPSTVVHVRDQELLHESDRAVVQ